MKNSALYFEQPGRVAVREEELEKPSDNEVTVKTALSAISAGSEMLFYHGDVSEGILIDPTLPGLQRRANYPLKYGYSSVGKVIEVGKNISPEWLGKRVFAFQSHQRYFNYLADRLIILPATVSDDDAVFIPNTETAICQVMDGKPKEGETAVILGQGVVGLLTAALLLEMKLAFLITSDYFPLRRERSLAMGAKLSLHPIDAPSQVADITFELTGNPEALNRAIDATAVGGRIVIGSWYGKRKVELDLSGHFHRGHITLISSQVSSIPPSSCSGYNKASRFETVLKLVERIKPSSLITQRIDFNRAAEAYRLLDKEPAKTIQVVLSYND